MNAPETFLAPEPTHTQVLLPSLPTLAQVRLSKLALLLGDVLALLLAFGVSMLAVAAWQGGDTLAWWHSQDRQRFMAWGGIASAGVLVLLTRFQHYSDRRPFWDEFGDLLKLVGLLALVDISLVAVVRWNASRLWWVVSWVLAFGALVLVRTGMRLLLQRLRLWVRPTIIVGVGSNAFDALRALSSHPELGLQVAGFVDAGGMHAEPVNGTQPRLPVDAMQALADRPGIHWVIALEHAQSDLREHWLLRLSQWGAADIHVIPAMRGVPLLGTDMSHFFSHEVAMLRIRNNLRRWPARLTKRLFDTVVASVLLVLLSPVLLGLALLVRRDGGPALFSQPRIGKRGKVFQCYKFRSMVVDAEAQLVRILQTDAACRAEWQRERKLREDPRISAIGRFLRRTSLDELPQLLNVIRGEMSLVGPRPIVQAELQRYGHDVDYYLMVRPGMTGLWQVSGRSDVEYDKRVYLDTWYVKNWSIWYDLVILVKTFQVVVCRRGAY